MIPHAMIIHRSSIVIFEQITKSRNINYSNFRALSTYSLRTLLLRLFLGSDVDLRPIQLMTEERIRQRFVYATIFTFNNCMYLCQGMAITELGIFY